MMMAVAPPRAAAIFRHQPCYNLPRKDKNRHSWQNIGYNLPRKDKNQPSWQNIVYNLPRKGKNRPSWQNITNLSFLQPPQLRIPHSFYNLPNT